jgi:hypothetical protein
MINIIRLGPIAQQDVDKEFFIISTLAVLKTAQQSAQATPHHPVILERDHGICDFSYLLGHTNQKKDQEAQKYFTSLEVQHNQLSVNIIP